MKGWVTINIIQRHSWSTLENEVSHLNERMTGSMSFFNFLVFVQQIPVGLPNPCDAQKVSANLLINRNYQYEA